MAADEYVQIHEYFPDWKYVYGALGMLLVAATLVTFRRQWPEQRLVLFLIVGGLAVMAAGGIIIEHVVLFRGCFDLVEDCFRLQIFEEFFGFGGFGGGGGRSPAQSLDRCRKEPRPLPASLLHLPLRPADEHRV